MNIVLIGFMGSGKSYYVKKLSKALGIEIVDTDAHIVASEGREISEIFESSGEEYFRKAETRAIAMACEGAKKIISVGGGAIFQQENAQILKENCKLVFLDTPFDTCYKRISTRDTRPLIKGKSRTEVLELYKQRLPKYRLLADATFATGGYEKAVLARLVSYAEEVFEKSK